jgi:hypothetical protein
VLLSNTFTKFLGSGLSAKRYKYLQKEETAFAAHKLGRNVV